MARLVELTRAGGIAIPLRHPHSPGRSPEYLAEAVERGNLSAQQAFGNRCESWLEDEMSAARVLLTPSCTAALELAVTLAGVGPGDEVVMPSFTSVSTALAVTRVGATPVFADIDPATFNLDPAAVSGALTARSRAIVPVHYAGVACDMEALGAIAREHGLVLIEDAAHAVGATWRGRSLGAIGDLGCLSFHETKNVSCGEGGALVVRDPARVDRAEVLRDKGTNRRKFIDQRVRRYTWVDQGSAYLLGELNAAYLWGQLEQLAQITADRLAVWHAYHERLAALEAQGALRRPAVPEDCGHNAHLYPLLLGDRAARDRAITVLAGRRIEAAFHFVPLHSSPAGRKLARTSGDMAVTDDVADRVLRLPLWPGMTDDEVERVVHGLGTVLG